MDPSPVLNARDMRWQTRRALIALHRQPLMSITLRAPHALREQPAFQQAFIRLCARLDRTLRQEGFLCQLVLSSQDADGPARHYVVADAAAVKARAIAFEEEASGGALLDIDLMDAAGTPLSRGDGGYPARACAVCGARPAAACISGRLHSAEQQRAAFDALLQTVASRSEDIAQAALQGLLYEVSVSPKPGLVDRFSPGAHADMDYYTFLRSASALPSYFLACAQAGEWWGEDASKLLAHLRPMGILAEQRMLAATGGVNTHKGMIFSLGILCAAAGMSRSAEPDIVCAVAGEIAAPALEDAQDGSHGAGVREKYGSLGVRGEAALGFPSVLEALPVLQDALRRGESQDRAGLLCLLRLMASVEDSNVLHRAGQGGLLLMREGARQLLEEGAPPDALHAYSRQLEERRISPGGCADLLALCFFLHALPQLSGGA